MITFVTFKWAARGYRSKFEAHHVNTLRSMVARHYAAPHRFVCLTDDPSGVECETMPIWDDYAGLRNPSYRDGPSCFRRLKLFKSDMGDMLGERIVSLDLDTVVTRDLVPLFDRPETFVAWRTPAYSPQINGSMFMLRAGAHPEVWDDFDPVRSPALSNGARLYGSDQGWISYKLPNCASWTDADGVYSYASQIARTPTKLSTRGLRRLGPHALPENARIVFFHGPRDPWMADTMRNAPWIKEHYR